MRNLQTVSLAILMAFAVVVPTFATTPQETAPAALPSDDQAILASILSSPFTPAVTATPAPVSRATQPWDYFYGYCSQDCTPCYSGAPYPQCPPDIYEGSGQSCLRVHGC